MIDCITDDIEPISTWTTHSILPNKAGIQLIFNLMSIRW